MTVETASFLSQLDATYPASGDLKSEGDNHLRLIKSAVKATFPNLTAAAVTPSTTELNFVTGVTSAIQTQLNAEITARTNADTTEATARALADTTETNERIAADALKANLASPTFTGVVTVPTPSNTTDAANKTYVDTLVTATAFSAALPSQTGNAGKFVTTNGISASWGTSATLAANTFTSAQEFATGASIASAATINLDASTGNRVHITGTTTITAVTLTRGPRTVIFDGVLTLTHHATNNNLPGAANITTAAGDRAVYESDGTAVYCVSYIKASGQPIIAASSGLVLLSTVTASSSATVDVDTTFSGTYDSYLIVGSGITVDTNATALRAIFKIGGSYDSGSNYLTHNNQSKSDFDTYVGVGSTSSKLSYLQVGDFIGNGSTDSMNFNMTIANPSSTVLIKSAYWHGLSIRASGPTIAHSSGVGANTGTSAMTGIRFFTRAGLILSGKFRLYGIANT